MERLLRVLIGGVLVKTVLVMLNQDLMREIPFSLGRLADPEAFHEPILIDGLDSSLLLNQLKQMMLIRLAEEKIGDEIVTGRIKCPCHLAIGQEAIPVGLSLSLNKGDKVFGTHRSHGHFLALGGSLEGLFAEVLGKASGCSRGRGGSMHLYGESFGFVGSVPIVGATISLAVGAALAAKMDGKGQVAVAYFGDGAAEEGTLHESLNMAANYKLPMIFVCENNLYSSHLHIGLRQPSDCVARYAAAHSIQTAVIDGNDISLVNKTGRALIEGARSGNGPVFIEAVTYRWRGHVGPREDNDVGVERKQGLDLWKKRDPIGRLLAAMVENGSLSSDGAGNLLAVLREEVNSAWGRSLNSPDAAAATLYQHIYADSGSEV